MCGKIARAVPPTKRKAAKAARKIWREQLWAIVPVAKEVVAIESRDMVAVPVCQQQSRCYPDWLERRAGRACCRSQINTLRLRKYMRLRTSLCPITSSTMLV